ncbi:MAG TPA: winged helix-turn-helix domain-containing protein [Streptomyces sp.]|nr:winged helix-turn-helix domain-containing protein [Streptomyces sp.]
MADDAQAADDSRDPLAANPAQDITLDVTALRVLAHPLRLTLLNRLRQHGPATARQLAAQFALDSGAASYHLRRLAAGGLIEEDHERGNRRDRWWRALHRTSFHDPAVVPPQERADSRAYTRAVVLAYGDELRRLSGTVPLLPDDWFDAAVFSDHTLRLTPDGLNRLKAELVGVIGKYRDAEAAAGEAGAEGGGAGAAESVSVQLQAFPLL